MASTDVLSQKRAKRLTSKGFSQRRSSHRIDLFRVLVHAVFLLLCASVLIPLLLLVSISLSSDEMILTHGYSIVPKQPTLYAYEWILSNASGLLQAYFVSSIVTSTGVFFGVLFTSMAGYPLSRRDFDWSKPITFYVIFKMLFTGGLVPTFIVVSRVLRLYNTLWALILPIMIKGWFILLMRGYFRTIPFEMIESAKLDGASEWQIFSRIIVQMAVPAMATLTLLMTLMYWNDWFMARLYIESANKVPLQFWMMRVMQNIHYLLNAADFGTDLITDDLELPTESARMAMAVLAAGPVLFIFPFFQRYFVKGIRVGSIKG